MAATNQNLKDFFALTGNNPPVTNTQLLMLGQFVQARTGAAEIPDADGVVDFIYNELKAGIGAWRCANTTVEWE